VNSTTETPVFTWGIELCDACGHRASYLACKGDLLLTFCGHHGQTLMLSLLGEDWEVDSIDD
jgi:hypothetical protein